MSRYEAVTNPTKTNDSATGYSIGSIWVNTTNSTSFLCVDNTVSNAVWKPASDTMLLLWAATAHGDPTTGQLINATYTGTRAGGFPTYTAGTFYWVQITNTTNGQNNQVNWNVTGFDFTKDFMFCANIYIGSGADGIYIGVGGSTTFGSGTSTTNNSLMAFYASYTNNNTRFFINGATVGNIKGFASGITVIGTWQLVKLEVKTVGSTRVARLTSGYSNSLDNSFIVTSWVPGGAYVCVGAVTGATNANQLVNFVSLEYI